MPPPAGSTIYEPTGYTPGDPVKLLLACHSAGRTGSDPFGTEGNACIASAQAAGYLVAASTAQGDGWGNAASCTDYLNLITYCEATYSVTGIMLWGSSMGGLAALTLCGYLRPAKIRGALLIQPVCDLDATYHDHTAFDTSINTAYGMGSWNAGTVGNYDPFDRPASEYAGLRYRFYASPSDTYVSKALNTDAMAAKIASVATEAAVVAVTGDHGDPSHWSWAAFAPFIARVFTTAPLSLVDLSGTSPWHQSGTSLTVSAPVGVRTSIPAGVYAAAAGYVGFCGTDASRFSVSSDGSTWASSLLVPAGASTVYLGVTPQSGDGALTASVGIPK